ncbi:MAG: hypothetical protein GC166_07210 [Alphaproteobacteria bacterium]|nr:hypothetical protein [Alphaproteobacteria bacterium]
MRRVAAIFASVVMFATPVLAAPEHASSTQGTLKPAGSAGTTNAQFMGRNGLLLLLGTSALIGAAALAASNGGKTSVSTTTTTPPKP